MKDWNEWIWKRPQSTEFPKIWRTFTAKDSDSDRLVEFRIEDLTESRYDEAIEIMVQLFCNGEPLCTALGVPNDSVAETDLVRCLWIPVLKQKMALVCYKNGSDEIVGLNMNFIVCKGEHFYEEAEQRVVSDKNKRQFAALSLLSNNFDVCEHYGVDKYLGSAGLVVTTKYRGRGIGEQFLKSRRAICKAFDITLTSTSFTSNYSNRIADKAGLQLDRILSYDEICDKHPELQLQDLDAEALTIKSKKFDYQQEEILE